jgi:hypothetical protein
VWRRPGETQRRTASNRERRKVADGSNVVR